MFAQTIQSFIWVQTLMTAAAVIAVVWPLLRRPGTLRSGSDVEVYRDQLKEIKRDQLVGLIGKTEAEAARVEISRRLIAAADAAVAPTRKGKPPTWGRRAVIVAALVALPIGAISLYLAIGSPSLPGQPLAARAGMPPAKRPIDILVAKMEVDLERNPNDGKRWEEIGRAYIQVERFNDAVRAWRNALRILGDSAERQSDLGESVMAAANGVVTTEAQAAFERAIALDPSMMSARFFLGVAAQQDGRREEAAKIWRNMIATAPAGAPWLALVRESLARVEAELAKVTVGPGADDLDAVAKLTPGQQTDTIRRMVNRLAGRLKEDGSDLEGWLKLVRAYLVLGERDKANGAASDARRALAHDPEKLRRIHELVKDFGLED
jgi:cytochrome c-type biogenesis protein CcmH